MKLNQFNALIYHTLRRSRELYVSGGGGCNLRVFCSKIVTGVVPIISSSCSTVITARALRCQTLYTRFINLKIHIVPIIHIYLLQSQTFYRVPRTTVRNVMFSGYNIGGQGRHFSRLSSLVCYSCSFIFANKSQSTDLT